MDLATRFRGWLLRTRLGPVCFALLTTEWQELGCPATRAGVARLSNASAACLAAIGGPASPLCIPSYKGTALDSGWPMAFAGMRPETCARSVERLLTRPPPEQLRRALSSTTGRAAGMLRVEVSVGVGKSYLLHATHSWPALATGASSLAASSAENEWRVELRVWRPAGLFKGEELETVAGNTSRAVLLQTLRQAITQREVDLQWAGYGVRAPNLSFSFLFGKQYPQKETTRATIPNSPTYVSEMTSADTTRAIAESRCIALSRPRRRRPPFPQPPL